MIPMRFYLARHIDNLQYKGVLPMTDPKPDVRAKVREHYGQIAEKFTPRPAEQSGCGCSSSAAGPSDYVAQMYVTDLDELPEDVTGLSLGSGDPIRLADLQPGETVIDLGSGGGIDCFLAGKQVGETGRVIGVDMTPQMIDKARANKARLGAHNVEFRLGEIEHLPVADNSADVVISNCVINLAPDKSQVLRDAYRALKPGGRLAISDIVTDRPTPDALREKLEAWAGCVGGALDVDQYVSELEAAGFEAVEIELAELNSTGVDIQIEEAGLGDTVKDGNHIIIGTGDGLIAIDLDDMDPTELPRPFSGKIKARKPLN
jgi:SAM-dependent methyltransferase